MTNLRDLVVLVEGKDDRELMRALLNRHKALAIRKITCDIYCHPERGRALVVDPEIEVWLWSESPNVARVLGRDERQPPLRAWLAEQGVWPPEAAKPSDPKRAIEMVLHDTGTGRSSSLYGEIAARASIRHCQDGAFAALLRTLREWFPLQVQP
jgi:hypothetical protein